MFFIFRGIFKWILEMALGIVAMVFCWHSFWAGYHNYDKTLGIAKDIIGQFKAIPAAYREFSEDCKALIKEDYIIIKSAAEEKYKFFMI